MEPVLFVLAIFGAGAGFGALVMRVVADRHEASAEKSAQRRLDEAYREGIEDGEERALDAIAENETSPFRAAARELRGRCPSCNRGCIHCARLGRVSGKEKRLS